MARLPPGKGGGEGGARGGTGKGLLLHRLTEAAGLPGANGPPPAHGDERAQVLPRLAARTLRTGKPGRPRTRCKVLATDTGYDAKAVRPQLRQRGSRAQRPQRVWKTTQRRGRALTTEVPRCQAERTFAGFQKKSRRFVVRWERLALCFTAFLVIATMHIWVQRLIVG
jgi:hypothetical protein